MKLLFIPGSGAGRVFWNNQTVAFPGSEAAALPGHPEGAPCPTIEAYTAWLHDYVAARGYQDVVMAGHSLGGAVVLQYALTYPGAAKGLILIGTGARLRVHPTMLEALDNLPPDKNGLRRFMDRARGFGEENFAPEAYEETLNIGLAVVKNDLHACDRFDVMSRLGEIKIPTLVIVGEHDELTPAKFGRYLADHIAGAEFVLVPEAHHTVCLTHPGAVNQAIRSFLARLA
jgi:pimeloyl-ACP methyl ester carboxylesterase